MSHNTHDAESIEILNAEHDEQMDGEHRFAAAGESDLQQQLQEQRDQLEIHTTLGNSAAEAINPTVSSLQQRNPTSNSVAPSKNDDSEEDLIDDATKLGDEFKPMSNALFINISQCLALSTKFLQLQFRQYKTNLCQFLFPAACMITIYILQIVLESATNDLTTSTAQEARDVFPRSVPLVGLLASVLDASALKAASLSPIVPPEKIAFSVENGVDLGKFYPNGTGEGILLDIWNQSVRLPVNGSLSYLTNPQTPSKVIPYAEFFSSLKDTELQLFDEIFNTRGNVSIIGAFQISHWDHSGNGLVYDLSYDNRSRTEFCNVASRLSATRTCDSWMQNELMNIVHRAYIYEASNHSLLLTSKSQQSPYFQREISFGLGDLLGYFFFVLILILLLPVFMYHIVSEKESGVREMMHLMRMKTRNYVAVQYFFDYLIYSIAAIEFVIFALIFHFKLIAESSPLLTFLTLSFWGVSLISFAFLLSAFLHRTAFASVLGYVFVIVAPSAAIVFQQDILCFMDPDTLKRVCPGYLKPLFVIFPLPLTHIIYTGSTQCLKGDCPTAEQVFTNPDLLWPLIFMLIDGVLYLVLGLYLEKVLKQPNEVPRSPFFPIIDLWKMTIGRFIKSRQRKGSEFGMKPLPDPHEDDDVRQLRQDIQTRKISPESCGILIDGIVKRYGKSKVAVKGVFIQVGHVPTVSETAAVEPVKELSGDKDTSPHNRQGMADESVDIKSVKENDSANVNDIELKDGVPIEPATPQSEDMTRITIPSLSADPKRGTGILGLLGENGCGKTSLIRILVGSQPATGGTAFIDGVDIRDTSQTHSIGYCPQFDKSLWDDLTVQETLTFYTRLKAVPFSKQKEHVKFLIKSLGLWKQRKRLVRHLTSGHKRCLSIAIALVGNPSVVVLDEPTGAINSVTAMKIWNLLNREKHNRCFIMTTHNMEEAQNVSDQICIMVQGRLKAYGDSEYLKRQFASGYQLNILLVDTKYKQAVMTFVNELLPTSSLVHSFSEHLLFSIPKVDARLGLIFRQMENKKEELGIENWNLKASTMEDVFLNVVNAADQQAATDVEERPPGMVRALLNKVFKSSKENKAESSNDNQSALQEVELTSQDDGESTVVEMMSDPVRET